MKKGGQTAKDLNCISIDISFSEGLLNGRCSSVSRLLIASMCSSRKKSCDNRCLIVYIVFVTITRHTCVTYLLFSSNCFSHRWNKSIKSILKDRIFQSVNVTNYPLPEYDANIQAFEFLAFQIDFNNRVLAANLNKFASTVGSVLVITPLSYHSFSLVKMWPSSRRFTS